MVSNLPIYEFWLSTSASLLSSHFWRISPRSINVPRSKFLPSDRGSLPARAAVRALCCRCCPKLGPVALQVPGLGPSLRPSRPRWRRCRRSRAPRPLETSFSREAPIQPAHPAGEELWLPRARSSHAFTTALPQTNGVWIQGEGSVVVWIRTSDLRETSYERGFHLVHEAGNFAAASLAVYGLLLPFRRVLPSTLLPLCPALLSPDHV